MNKAETSRFKRLYQSHLRLLKLQGKSQKTIDANSRAVRRISEHFDCCPDQLTLKQREKYFSDLVESHSWSTVKIDRNGLQFFWKHVLKQDWQWINIVRPPKIHTLPDILTLAEVEHLIGATRKLRYRVFLLATYSMGLRLGETLALQVGDIDGKRKQVHIRRGKTVKGEDFLWLVLQHVLPKGFRRVRDYGFLHGNAKKLLSLVQMVLQVLIQACAPRLRPAFKCPKCRAAMRIIAFRRPAWASG